MSKQFTLTAVKALPDSVLALTYADDEQLQVDVKPIIAKHPTLRLDWPRLVFGIFGRHFLRLCRPGGIDERPAAVGIEMHSLPVGRSRRQRGALQFGGETLPRHQNQHHRCRCSHSLPSTQA